MSLLSGYIDKQKNNKKKMMVRAVCGMMVAFAMLIFSIIFMKGTGIKNLVLCSGLSLFSGAMIVIPKYKLLGRFGIIRFCILILLYACFVPVRIFNRTESAIGNDMSTLFDGARFLNVCIILMLFFIILFISQRTSIALGTTGIICLIITIINYYVCLYRGTALSLLDFKSAATTLTIMGGYTYDVSAEMWKSFAYYMAFITLGFKIDLDLKGVRYHIIISIVAISGFITSLLTFKNTSYWNTPGLDGNGTYYGGETPFGTYLYLWMSATANEMPKPIGYSDARLTRIAEEVESEYVSETSNGEIKPNIILIMNEAWSDLSVLGNLETTVSYKENYDTLNENAIKGYTYVNIQGGMTADSEFEALTGNSMALLNVASVPYEMQVNHDMPSFARVLKQQGYYTMAFHPNVSASWRRGEVYNYFGFDEFVTVLDMQNEPEKIGGYISDKSNYEELIYRFENRDKDKPLFLFNVTIQNHSGYWEQTPIDVKVTKTGNTQIDANHPDDGSVEGNKYKDVNEYLSLMKITDEEFGKLIEYFSNVDEPTIVCMFGDHQPVFSFSKEFYTDIFEGQGLTESQQKEKQLATPYIIWANYDIAEKEYGDISANMIAPILCEVAGIEMPTNYKFLLNMRNEVPYLNIYNYDRYKGLDVISNYRMIQYNQLMVEDYRKDIFEK